MVAANQKGVIPRKHFAVASRLMKDGLGEGYTREDHLCCAEPAVSAYSKVQEIPVLLASVIGEEGSERGRPEVYGFWTGV